MNGFKCSRQIRLPRLALGMSILVTSLLVAGVRPAQAQVTLPRLDPKKSKLKSIPSTANPVEAQGPTPVTPQPVSNDTAGGDTAGGDTAGSDTDQATLGTTEVHSASFQSLTPGTSRREQVEVRLGKPRSTESNDQILHYQLGPFRDVEIQLDPDGLVNSIILRLEKPIASQAAAQELELSEFEPCPIKDGTGQLLGLIYPERAITLIYSESAPGQVEQLLLDRVSVEPFLMRSRALAPLAPEEALGDLAQAIQLEPESAKVHLEQAELLTKLGRISEAKAVAQRAIELSKGQLDPLLVRARIAALEDDRTELSRLIQQVVQAETATPYQRAVALLLRGELEGTGPSPNDQASMNALLGSIEAATNVASSADPDWRERGQQLLLDGYLAVARNIARGNWKKKDKVIPQWLENADVVLQELQKASAYPNLIRLEYLAQRMEIGSYYPESGSIEQQGDVILSTARTLISRSTDAAYQKRIEWIAGTGLYHAASLTLESKQHEVALNYLKAAYDMLKSAQAIREPTPESEYLLGNVAFRIGSIFALYREDHRQASTWYERALQSFERPLPASRAFQLGIHGERFVSMGVSFWNQDKRELAGTLTRQGAQWMEQAVNEGNLEGEALRVPYVNLASILRAMGDAQEASSYEDKAKRIERKR